MPSSRVSLLHRSAWSSCNCCVAIPEDSELRVQGPWQGCRRCGRIRRCCLRATAWLTVARTRHPRGGGRRCRQRSSSVSLSNAAEAGLAADAATSRRVLPPRAHRAKTDRIPMPLPLRIPDTPRARQVSAPPPPSPPRCSAQASRLIIAPLCRPVKLRLVTGPAKRETPATPTQQRAEGAGTGERKRKRKEHTGQLDADRRRSAAGKAGRPEGGASPWQPQWRLAESLRFAPFLALNR
jgi:hypothetical protein